MLEDCIVYVMHVISIIDAIKFTEQNKHKGKKNIQEAADIEMADLSGENSSKMQSIIDKAVACALKGKDKVTNKVSTFTFRDVLAFSYGEASSSQGMNCKLTSSSEAEQEEDVLFLQKSEGSHGETVYSATHSWQEGQSYQWGKASQVVQEGARQRQGQGQEKVLQLTGYRYGEPQTLPDWLLTVPFTQAVELVILNTPVDIINAAQFKNYVHSSPGVNLPDKIAFQLSVGLRYMYHQPLNKKLILESWHDFQRRLR